MVSGHCTTLCEHVISMRTSYFDIDFASQMKLTKFPLNHCFGLLYHTIRRSEFMPDCTELSAERSWHVAVITHLRLCLLLEMTQILIVCSTSFGFVDFDNYLSCISFLIDVLFSEFSKIDLVKISLSADGWNFLLCRSWLIFALTSSHAEAPLVRFVFCTNVFAELCICWISVRMEHVCAFYCP